MKCYGQVKGRAHRNDQPLPSGRMKRCAKCGQVQRLGKFMKEGKEYKLCYTCRMQGRVKNARYRERLSNDS